MALFGCVSVANPNNTTGHIWAPSTLPVSLYNRRAWRGYVALAAKPPPFLLWPTEGFC